VGRSTEKKKKREGKERKSFRSSTTICSQKTGHHYLFSAGEHITIKQRCRKGRKKRECEAMFLSQSGRGGKKGEAGHIKRKREKEKNCYGRLRLRRRRVGRGETWGAVIERKKKKGKLTILLCSPPVLQFPIRRRKNKQKTKSLLGGGKERKGKALQSQDLFPMGKGGTRNRNRGISIREGRK